MEVDPVSGGECKFTHASASRALTWSISISDLHWVSHYFPLLKFTLTESCVSAAAEKTNQVSGDPSTNQSVGEERGDLIQFYNSVFVLKMKSFAQQYATHDNRVGHARSVRWNAFDFIKNKHDLTVDDPPGGCSSSLPVPVRPSSASLSSADLSETFAVRLSAQELHELPHTKLLYLQDQQQPVQGKNTHTHTGGVGVDGGTSAELYVWGPQRKIQGFGKVESKFWTLRIF